MHAFIILLPVSNNNNNNNNIVHIIRPHRSTTYVDAAYCYRRSGVVCLSGLSVTIVNPAKTDRDDVWVVESGGPKEACVRRGSTPGEYD